MGRAVGGTSLGQLAAQQPAPTGGARGAEVVSHDLAAVPLDAAWTKTKQPPLKCLKAPEGARDPCVFGLRELRGPALGGEVVVALSDHLAGAVYKITYAGTEFVVPMQIVGGSYQWAFSYDIRTGHNEQYNPTEAGCAELDSFTTRSSSKVLEVRAGANAVYTRTQPAFFRAPGVMLVNKQTGKKDVPVLNKTVLSNIVLEKRLEFTGPGQLDMTASVQVPAGKHYFSINSLACWCPIDSARQVQVLTREQWAAMGADALYFADRQQARGMLVATRDGRRAMGIALLEWPSGELLTSPYYRSQPNPARDYVMWTIGHRFGNKDNTTRLLPGGKYGWKVRMFFGTVEQVKAQVQQQTAQRA